ncbi:MAG: M1 family metallopeptidase [Ferruginibacter sp.]
MKKIVMICFGLMIGAGAIAQGGAQNGQPADTTWKTIFRESALKINDLVHTKLEVNFDYDKSYMYGKEWLTLKPHFYPTDSVQLDAKGMIINSVSIMNGTTKSPLKYSYDDAQLNIKLDKTYTRDQKYTLYFDYVSRPNELKVKGSAAITDAKGLYFINPKGEVAGKPIQIWTQGETEANSAWMVTIDKPNQKSTEEIYMTVPDKYVTLSNGLLISKKVNNNGTRTDYWKMDLPHAPYLFFMGVGDYAIIKDAYKGKEVSYYVEKAYAPYARQIFGLTPEMIKFYSEKLGVDFPWQKYAQIVGRDYVSGAMENTTATLHQESAYQNGRQLADGNAWESVIAHELFHQWFGDLVTAESWSNITVNESFADYSEYLWYEYKYGKDKADEHHIDAMDGYLGSKSENKDLVRYHYKDKEDVFDAVSYNKGGRILHMLRNYVGDDAFFKSLNNYLTTNKFKTGEADQLRLAFEEVTGKDLNWFWNQWYYGSGHPKLKLDYNYDAPNKVAMLTVQQTQDGNKTFTLPVKVDVYANGVAKRYNIWLQNRTDTFYFASASKPDLIDVDAEKVLLADIEDNKAEGDYIYQYNNVKTFAARMQSLEYFAKHNMPEIAKGFNDKYEGIRSETIKLVGNTPYKSDARVLTFMENMAKADRIKKVRAAAINYLVKNGDKKYLPIYQAAISDSSYSVSGAALKGIAALDAPNAYNFAKKYSSDAKGSLGNEVSAILMDNGKPEDFEFISMAYKNSAPSFQKVGASSKFAAYLATLNNIADIKKGIDYIVEFRNMIPESFRPQVDPGFKAAFDKIVKAKGSEIETYVNKVFK